MFRRRTARQSQVVIGARALIAFAIARRACSRRFSSLFAAWPASLSGSRARSRSRSKARSRSSSSIAASRSAMLSSRSASIDASVSIVGFALVGDGARSVGGCDPSRFQYGGEQVGRVAYVEPGLPQVKHATRVGRRDHRIGRSPPQGRGLAVADAGRELRLEHGVRAAGAAAQAVVVGFGEGVRGAEDRADRAVAALHVPQVARVLYDDSGVRGPDLGHSFFRDPLGEVAHTRAERRGLRGTEQAAVILHGCSAPGAVDDDRRLARHRRDHPPGEAARVFVAAGVQVQRAATVAAAVGPGDARTRRLHHAHGRSVRVAEPRVHDAAGEAPRARTPPVGTATGDASERAERRGSPNRRGTRRTRWAAHTSQVNAMRSVCTPRSRYATQSAARRARDGEPPRSWSAARVCSMRCPKCTEDGHAASQPRHCTHSSIAVSNAASIGRPSSSTKSNAVSSLNPAGNCVCISLIITVTINGNNHRKPLQLYQNNWRDRLGIEPSKPGTQVSDGFEDRGGHQNPIQPRNDNISIQQRIL